jgi:hypothetical protein
VLDQSSQRFWRILETSPWQVFAAVNTQTCRYIYHKISASPPTFLSISTLA